MEKRFSKESKGSLSLQRRLLAESALKQSQQQQKQPEQHVPDLTDFMNDMFFGTVKNPEVVKKSYNLTGGDQAMEADDRGEEEDDDDDDGYVLDSPRSRSSNSRLTQEWLEEAKRMVASSPSRCDSPSRLFGSPRFAAATAAAQNQALAAASLFDRRDPLSRSARRFRSVESFSGEILSKSAKHSRSNSETLDLDSPSAEFDSSPSSSVHRWFSSILKPTNSSTPPSPTHDPTTTITAAPAPAVPIPTAQTLPPRQSVHRKSRFQTDSSAAQQLQIPPLSRRTFKTSAAPFSDTHLLSPPKNLIESAHRRSISSSTCSMPGNRVLSPPRNLVESAHRRSISSTTCAMDKVLVRVEESGKVKDGEGGKDLNVFLREQRAKIEKILSGDEFGKAKIVLSGPSNSTSSMVAAICHAWLLENRIKNNKEGADGGGNVVVVPVINVKRGQMWKQRQAAWLFHHVGVDATALLFADELDLESLMMSRQLSMLVVGQDILKSDNEVGSQCTILTDNYCEDAYDLLQTPLLKKLLLAGILLDTQNLNASAKLSMTRDAEAVQLLLVGSAPNYKNALFDLLIQDQKESSFLEALRCNYGKPPRESARDIGAIAEGTVSERKSTSISYNEAILHDSNRNFNNTRSAKINTMSPKSVKQKSSPAQAPIAAPAQAAPDASRGKNKFFLAKWFGFGSK